MARDLDGYFDKLMRQGRGGRRLDGDGNDFEMPEPDERPADSPAETTRRSGGLGLIIEDIVGRARSAATRSKQARDAFGERRRNRAPTKRSALPPEGVVTIEYAPRIDGDPDPGEVVWTRVPFEDDPQQGKDRPVVVIGRRGRSLVGLPLTTRQNDREAQIAIGTGDWDPKRRPSYVRIWRMLDIDVDETRREGAILARDRFDAVVAAVDEYYDIRRPARVGVHGEADRPG